MAKQRRRRSKHDKYFCYIYKDPKTDELLYVGYGTDPQRAHTPGHNAEVAKLKRRRQQPQIWIAGPYESESAARNIEAALVSAVRPPLNRIEQPGIKFRPLGMPDYLFDRRGKPVLDVHQVSRMGQGAIIVYCNYSSRLKSGKPKLTLTNFSDEVIFHNIEDHWYVRKFLRRWIEDPSTSPRTLIAVQGPPDDRVIVAAAVIDIQGWKSTPTAKWDSSVHRVPLRHDRGLDAYQLRGRRIEVRFGAGKANYIMIGDSTGLVLHGYRMKGKRGSQRRR